MSFTYSNLAEFIDHLFGELIPNTPNWPASRNAQLQGYWDVAKVGLLEHQARGDTAAEALGYMMQSIPGMIANFAFHDTTGSLPNPWPSNPFPFGELNPIGWENNISAQDIVSYFGGATMSPAEQAKLVAAIEAGTLPAVDFVGSLVLVQASGQPLTAEAVLEHGVSNGLVTSPDLALELPGVPDGNAAFLLGLYIAAFARAGEHDGVTYWAQQLGDKITSGLSTSDAYTKLAADLYWVGSQYGEAGTDIASTRDYVTFVYENVLGRAPDAGGLQYWVKEIENGTIPRSEFLASFLYSALQSSGDSEYLHARIEVATYVAQPDVTGVGKAWPDLVDVLDGVVDAGSAWAKIGELKSGISVASLLDAELISLPALSASVDADALLLLSFEDAGQAPVLSFPDDDGLETMPLVLTGDAGHLVFDEMA